jgi:hypothetical protein
MMKKSLIMFFVLLIVSGLNAQDSTLGKLFRSSYHVWELQRNGIGVYRDSKLFAGADYHPSSVANVGIGLISLCIADSMGWDANAELKALTTLKSMTGHTPGFKPERNASGFYRHFIDMNTGARAWDSEFSTIDTEILMAAALFAKNYFRNDSISKYALEMWNSIQHEKAIADAANGKIYLTMNANGNGNPGSVTSVYNEYMIVAWMAKNATENTSSPAHILWNKFYADPDKLPYTMYGANRVLTDYPGGFLSSFTHQFNYYLCHYFSTSAKYLDYYIQALNADMAWWKTISNAAEWEWGCGAGTGPNGYNADKINGNSTRTVSPHIIAGFLPVFPEGENQIEAMWQSKKGRYVFPQYSKDTILWRYSLINTAWKAPEVQGIDYSTMLFGLAALPQFLGKDFFIRNNNFFDFSTASKTEIQNFTEAFVLKNQTRDKIEFAFVKPVDSPAEIQILNLNLEIVFRQKVQNRNIGETRLVSISGLANGVYFLRILQDDRNLGVKKFVKY